MDQRHQATITRRVQEAPGVISLYFTVDSRPLPHVAGQYITVYFDDTNVPTGKAYSLSSCPNDSASRITVKKIGLFSGKLHQLKVGDQLSISPAYGFFNTQDDRPIVALAGGVGIAPIWSLICDELGKNSQRPVELFYSNKTRQDVVFRSEIDKLSQKCKSFKVRHFITRETIDSAINRRIDIKKDVDLTVSNVFYICGAVDFVGAMWRQLAAAGVDQDSISTESFFEAD